MLNYSCENWTVNWLDRREIESADMKFLRSIADLPPRYLENDRISVIWKGKQENKREIGLTHFKNEQK
jgi:hypothetical protein